MTASTFTRSPHVRRTRSGPVAVRRSRPIQRMGRAVQAVKDGSRASYATMQALTAPGDRRERARYAAKLGLKAGAVAGVGTCWVAGQTASVGLSVGAAVAVILGSVAFALWKQVEPKSVRRARTALFRARRQARRHLDRAATVYTGTRQRTAVRRRA